MLALCLVEAKARTLALELRAEQGCPVKIATFNINGINGRLANLLEWLEHARPDVVALQEIKCFDAAFPAKAIEGAGYGAIWRGQGPHHGVAILARGQTPIATRRAPWRSR